MKPEDVPAELAALGTHAVDMHPSTSFLAPCESLARAVLAAVLPEHEKQVRAKAAERLRVRERELVEQMHRLNARDAYDIARNVECSAYEVRRIADELTRGGW